MTRSLQILFESISERSCIWCPPKKISLKIRRFNLQGHCWLYEAFPEMWVLVIPGKSRNWFL